VVRDADVPTMPGPWYYESVMDLQATVVLAESQIDRQENVGV
jgi:hypothetical protein